MIGQKESTNRYNRGNCRKMNKTALEVENFPWLTTRLSSCQQQWKPEIIEYFPHYVKTTLNSNLERNNLVLK